MLVYKWQDLEDNRVRLYRDVTDLMGSVISRTTIIFEWIDNPPPSYMWEEIYYLRDNRF